jgi:hypothetical protein
MAAGVTDDANDDDYSPIPLDRAAVGRGGTLGLAVLVFGTVIGSILDSPGVVAVTVLIALFVAGFVAGRLMPDEPMSNGLVAAEVAWIAWIPIRVLIWAVHKNGHELFSGNSPALPIGGLFVTAVFAAGLGVVGGLAGASRARRMRS